jgi:hypothetical protein
MKQKEIVVDPEQLKPQQSLEKILQLEIEIAEKIAAAKEKADKKVTESQNNISDRKNQIIDEARRERDRMLTEGIAGSKKLAEEKVSESKTKAEEFLKVGKKFEEEAAEQVLKLIVESGDQEEK